jgi:FO synthase subunit 2
MIREIGRTPAERTTTYKILKKFNAREEETHPLDRADYSEQKFGSYQNIIKLDAYRFRDLTKEIQPTVHSQE